MLVWFPKGTLRADALIFHARRAGKNKANESALRKCSDGSVHVRHAMQGNPIKESLEFARLLHWRAEVKLTIFGNERERSIGHDVINSLEQYG